MSTALNTVVNESLERAYFGGPSPIGQHITTDGAPPQR